MRIRSMVALALLLSLVGVAQAQSTQPLAFSGDFSAVDIGFDSKWWPGGGETPGGSPIQVRIAALGVADVDSEFSGTVSLSDDTLILGPGGGSWGYDFGASVSMQVAINLSFEIPNPLPFGDDIAIGPWVLDLPWVPGFDLVNSQSTQLNSWLLDEVSVLEDETDEISVYDLSLIEYLIGGINLPDWALTILQLDAGASLNASITTVAALGGNAINLSDGNSFVDEGQSKDVDANAPAYSVNADYDESFAWDLVLNFKPAVFIKILGQRFDLPIITIPWQVLKDARDMSYTTATLSFPVAEDPIEGEGEGVIEGVVDGEEEPIDFPTGCAPACEAVCDGTFLAPNLAEALAAVYADRGNNIATTDADANGIVDRTHFMFAESLLVSAGVASHCCIANAWQSNYLAVELMAGFSGDRFITDLQGNYLTVLATLATIGEPGAYAQIEALADSQGWTIDLHQLDPSAGHYLGKQGDADLDGVCNWGEYQAVAGDAVNFILAASSLELALNPGACQYQCQQVGEGEAEVEEGEQPLRWTLSIIEEGTGTGDVVVTPEQADYAEGQVVTLTVFLGRNSILAGWNGVDGVQEPGENGSEVIPMIGTNRYTIIMNSNKVLHPHFWLYAPIEGEEDGEEPDGEPEGTTEGEEPTSDADLDADGIIGLQELLRLIQLYNNGAYYCGDDDDGFAVTPPATGTGHDCAHHTSDYAPADWVIQLTELLRLVQFYNLGGYIHCDSSEDGFCVVTQP